MMAAIEKRSTARVIGGRLWTATLVKMYDNPHIIDVNARNTSPRVFLLNEIIILIGGDSRL
jgi:predicted ATP-grasp superfamily ATP-dependent carboligase